VASTNLVAESLSDPLVTGAAFTKWNPDIFPAGNIFNTADIQVVHAGTNMLDSGTIRCCDIHDRQFLIYGERTNSTTNTGLQMKMNLAAYCPSITNIMAFTNDVSLTNDEVLNQVLPDSSYGNNLSVKVTLNRYRTMGYPDVITRSMPIKIGDINALCLNFGRVSQEMLEPEAQNVWNVEKQIKSTPGITNTLTVNQYQGALVYLMGMSYYEKVDHFIPIDAQLCGRTPVTDVGIGLAKLICKPGTSTGTLPTGAIVYNQPCVDMEYNERIMAEAPTANAATGEELDYANDNFNILTIVDGSAKEHVTINDFFNQVDSVSTVKLLQLAAQRHASNPTLYKDIVVLNQQNVNSILTNIVPTNGVSPLPWALEDLSTNFDVSIWGSVLSAVANSQYNQALMTPGDITNNTGSYLGTGALIINSQGYYAALITGTANGGWGPYLPDDSFMNDNLANVSLDTDGDGNYSVDFTAPSLNYEPLAADVFDPSQTLSLSADAGSGFLQYTPFSDQWAAQSAEWSFCQRFA
jgi:hypothetical protein